MTAKGQFEADLRPEHNSAGDGLQMGRMAITKTFSGDLTANSTGTMLSVRTPIETSAGYVAVEKITGTLNGKRGTFAVQHYGIMSGGTNRLTIDVIPDSGSGELAGIAGSMEIDIKDGKHFYSFEYTLP